VRAVNLRETYIIMNIGFVKNTLMSTLGELGGALRYEKPPPPFHTIPGIHRQDHAYTKKPGECPGYATLVLPACTPGVEMITKWLKDRTPAEKEEHIKTLIAMSLKQLRHNQDVVNASRKKAFEMYTTDKESQFQHIRDRAENKFNPIFENCDLMYEDLIEAIDRKCFS
jgi:hypothetical protein